MANFTFSGHSSDELAQSLDQAEGLLNNGESIEIALISTDLPSPDEIDAWYQTMVAEGHHVSRPTSGVSDGYGYITFTATKGSPLLLALIPLIPTALVVGLITFGIVKLESITNALLPLVLALGGITIIGLALIRQPATQVATAYLKQR